MKFRIQYSHSHQVRKLQIW